MVIMKNASVYLRTGQLDRALIRLNKAISLYPKYAEALHLRGRVWFKKNLFEKACLDWKNSCKFDTAWCQGSEFAEAGGICP